MRLALVPSLEARNMRADSVDACPRDQPDASLGAAQDTSDPLPVYAGPDGLDVPIKGDPPAVSDRFPAKLEASHPVLNWKHRRPCGRRNSLDERAQPLGRTVAGSTFTPGPMVEEIATRCT